MSICLNININMYANGHTYGIDMELREIYLLQEGSSAMTIPRNSTVIAQLTAIKLALR